MKVVQVTDRTKFQVSSSRFQDLKMAVRTEVVRDTVYVERKDSVVVDRGQLTVEADFKGLHLLWLQMRIGTIAHHLIIHLRKRRHP